MTIITEDEIKRVAREAAKDTMASLSTDTYVLMGPSHVAVVAAEAGARAMAEHVRDTAKADNGDARGDMGSGDRAGGTPPFDILEKTYVEALLKRHTEDYQAWIEGWIASHIQPAPPPPADELMNKFNAAIRARLANPADYDEELTGVYEAAADRITALTKRVAELERYEAGLHAMFDGQQRLTLEAGARNETAEAALTAEREKVKGLEDKRWHLGSMNDGLFIIDRAPSPSGTDVPPHANYGPGVVLNVTDLPLEKAQAIVDAHNAALAAGGEG